MHLDFKKNKPKIFIPGERKGEWVVLPDKFVITEWDVGLPYDLAVTFKVSVENGCEIEKFEATKKDIEITNKGLSKIKLAALLAEAIDLAGITMKEENGVLKGSILEMKQKHFSEDVIKRATKKRRKNSVSFNEAKRVADYARRLIEKGDPNWSAKTMKAFSITRATMNRRFEIAKFKPAKQIKKRKEGKK